MSDTLTLLKRLLVFVPYSVVQHVFFYVSAMNDVQDYAHVYQGYDHAYHDNVQHDPFRDHHDDVYDPVHQSKK